jgi:diacylglycerol O-acyltransferase
MSSVDAAWLGMEDPTNLMMVTGVMALDGPVDLKRLRLTLDRRLAPFARFHQRVVRPRSRANIAHWEDDPAFDVENHLSHISLPSPGTDATLRKLVSDVMSEPLDFSKPLWHMHVIDGYRGGSVILTRVHHSIADGIALVRVLLSLTDETADAKPPAAARRPASMGFRMPLDWLPAAIRHGVGAGAELALKPDRVLGLARVGAHGAYRLGRMVVLPPDPPTVFKGKLGRRKKAAWSESLPLDDFKAIGKAFGATVNDVLVATATGALRRYMERRGEATAGVAIRASVPVNLRPLERAHELGNAFGLVFLTLPVGEADPVRRLRLIKKEMDDLKQSPEALVAFGVLSLMGFAPVEVEQVGLRFFGSKATAVLTNVPGPKQPLYMAGRQIDRVMFWVPQSGHLGLGISIISYAGGVMLGVATDAGLVPDPERIVEAFKTEFETMRHLASPRSGEVARPSRAGGGRSPRRPPAGTRHGPKRPPPKRPSVSS